MNSNLNSRVEIERERRKLEKKIHRSYVVDVERRILILCGVAILAFLLWKYANQFHTEYGYVSGSEIVTESGIIIYEPSYESFCNNNVNGRRVTVEFKNGSLNGIYTDNTGILHQPNE